MDERDIPYPLQRAKPGWLVKWEEAGTYWTVLSEHTDRVLAVEEHPGFAPPGVSPVVAFSQPFEGTFYKIVSTGR